MLTVTALYAALLALVYVRLALAAIRARRSSRIALGEGDDPALLRATRAHANFAEYVPLSLILLGCAELNGAHWSVLHALGLALLAGRILHARGLQAEPESFKGRIRGMQLTLYGLIVSAFVNLVLAAWTAVPS